MSDESTAAEAPATLEPERLKALAHPLRLRLLNALSANGPATASALAARLGESSGATSYHLRQLEKHGFVREDPDRGTARERYWMRESGTISIDTRAYAPGSAEQMAAGIFLTELKRERSDEAGRYLRYGADALPKAWFDTGVLRSGKLALTIEQLTALAAELQQVLDGYIDRYRGQEGDDVRRVRVDIDAFPLVDAPGVDA